MSSDEDEPSASTAAKPRILNYSSKTAFLNLRATVLHQTRTAKPTSFDEKTVAKPKKNILAPPPKAGTKRKLEEKQRAEHDDRELKRLENMERERQKAMEAKTKLYERLQSGERFTTDDGKQPELLVDFDSRSRQRSRSASPEAGPVHYDPTADTNRFFGAAHLFLPADEEQRRTKIDELMETSRKTAETRWKVREENRRGKREAKERVNAMRALRGLDPLPVASSDEEEDVTQHPGFNLYPSQIPLPEDPDAERKAEEERKKKFVREWDRDKVDGLDTQWVNAARDERNDEFRPPDVYFRK